MRQQVHLTLNIGRRCVNWGALLASVLLLAFPAISLGSESTPAGVLAPIGQIEPSQLDHFAIFGSPPEPFPSEPLAHLIQVGPLASHGFNISLTQEAKPPSGPPFWVVPGRGYILVVSRDGETWATTPSPIKRAIQNGVSLSIGEGQPTASKSRARDGRHVPSFYLAMGMVPNGVIRVKLGQGITARVENNVYARSVEQSELFKTRF